MSRIGLLGSYGGLNVGDEAILTAILDGLRREVPFAEIVLFSRDAGHSRDAHQVDRVLDARRSTCDAVNEEIAGLDVLVLGGGGLLYDGEATEYLRHVRTAQRHGVPTVAYAIGAGPLTTPQDRRAVRDVVSAMTRVTVRDEESRRVLEEVGVERPVQVTSDPAVLLAPQPFPVEALIREGLDTTGRLIAMSVREPGRAAPHLSVDAYHSLLAAVADFAVHRYQGQVVFIPMERGDLRESHAVLAQMVAPDRARVLHGSYSPGELLGLMEHMDLAVGMRLHFLIFAAVSGVPFLPLPYAGKVADFARAVGLPTLPSVDRDAVGPLLSAVDQLWDERNHYAPQMRGRIEKLRPRAAATLQYVLELLPQPLRGAAAEGDQADEKGVGRAAVAAAGSSAAADPPAPLGVPGS